MNAKTKRKVRRTKVKRSGGKISRSEFLGQLKSVASGLGRACIFEQCDCFVFREGLICTFNDEVACSIKFPLNVEGAVYAELLLKMLRKMPEEEVDIDAGNGKFTITGKRFSVDFRMEKPVKMPLEAIERPEKWRKLPDEFLEALRTVLPCAGRDESKFASTCVHIHPDWVEACDDYQLARYFVKTGVKQSILTPRGAARGTVAMDADELSETENWVHFRSASGGTLSCRRYAQQYPNLDLLVDLQEGQKAELPIGLKDAVDRTEILSGGNRFANWVTVELRKGRLRLEGEGSGGRYWEQAKCSFKGHPVRFRIETRLLLGVLRRSRECVLGQRVLKVDGGNFVYAACVHRPKQRQRRSKASSPPRC